MSKGHDGGFLCGADHGNIHGGGRAPHQANAHVNQRADYAEYTGGHCQVAYKLAEVKGVCLVEQQRRGEAWSNIEQNVTRQPTAFLSERPGL